MIGLPQINDHPIQWSYPSGLSTEQRIDELLHSIIYDDSQVSSAAYDTAWAARLGRICPGQGFEAALTWLRENQHADGSWGGSIIHFHDRIVSTLAAIVALQEIGDEEDTNRIQAGQKFLWQNSPRLHYDANDTIGFPVVIVSLMQQARNLNIDIPPNIFQGAEKIEKKLNLLDFNPNQWRFTTLHYSIEALLNYLPSDIQVDFADEMGCVGTSPSATVATVLDQHTYTDRSLTYLKNLIQSQPDGGLPTVDRIDVFEAAWSLSSLRHIDWLTPDHPGVRPILDLLWEGWSNEQGIGFSRYFNVKDLDDTATTFPLLRWGGYPVDASVFAYYETETHFRCFEGELDASVSAQIRMLAALQSAKDHPLYRAWSEKIIRNLRVSDLNGQLWFDKWHMSPYYMTTAAIWMLHGVIDDLLEMRIKWIIQSQNTDGGWGYYGASTLEETTYCLKALLYWHNHVEPISDPIHMGAAYFMQHAFDRDQLVPMWIGKGVYTPYKAVQSSVESVLYSLQQYYG